MTPKFDADSVARYEFANGHKARGAGAWMFGASYSDGRGAWTADTYSTPSLPFGAAKAAAKKYFKGNAPSGATECYFAVLP